MKLLLDTNVLLRLSDAAHSANPEAEAAVGLLNRAGHECVLVPQVLYEFWSVATRPLAGNGLGLDVPVADAIAGQWTSLFHLMRDERGVYDLWRSLVVEYSVKGKTAHDARLVAAMRRHGLTHLLTYNAADFARYRGIVMLTPSEVVAGRLTV